MRMDRKGGGVEPAHPPESATVLWLDSQHDNLPKGIRTIKMCI